MHRGEGCQRHDGLAERYACFIGPVRASFFLSGRRLQQKEQLRAAGKTSVAAQLAPTCATKASSLLQPDIVGRSDSEVCLRSGQQASWPSGL